MNKPLCFVLMPFGKKPDGDGSLIDFDRIYDELLHPAIADADLEPLRADEEAAGGIIHVAMFERLLLCPYAIADLTTANANVFYELGVRHAVRPHTTIPVFRTKSRLPFDVTYLRAIPYATDSSGTPAKAEEVKALIQARLRDAREAKADSPVFQLIQDYTPPDVDHTKTDTFRDRVDYAREIRKTLAEARRTSVEAVRSVEEDLTPLVDADAGCIVDLFLSYRALESWEDMVRLYDSIARPLRSMVMIREQRALALNRLGRRDQAERELLELIEERGPSSETYGLLGRVYKDRWEDAKKQGRTELAAGELRRAKDAYLRGFEADWRDAYPGINALTLMELEEPPDPQRRKIFPVVRYSVERRLSSKRRDYWDYATQLELAVLGEDRDAAAKALADALPSIRECWEPKTTARNLRLILEARKKRDDEVSWIRKTIDQLTEGAD